MRTFGSVTTFSGTVSRLLKRGEETCSKVLPNPILSFANSDCNVGAAAEAEEDVAWDEDSDDEAAPKVNKSKGEPGRPASTESSATLHPATQNPAYRPDEKRKSHDEKSQADSDGSYDVVGAASGAPSHAPGSPENPRKVDDSEEEDWE